MSSLRVWICGGDRESSAHLESLLAGLGCSCRRVELAELERKAERPELLVLGLDDNPRGDLTGVMAFRDLPVVTFSTSERMATKAFDLHAVDFLLTPTTKERLEGALERARQWCSAARLRSIEPAIESFVERAQRRQANSSRLRVERDDRAMTFVTVGEIDWIEPARRGSRVHVGGEVYSLREGLAALERALAGSDLLRIHRSAIANLGRVERLESRGRTDYDLVLDCGERLAVGRAYASEVRRRLYALAGSPALG